MADKMGFSKLEFFPKSFMRWLAARHVPVFKKRVEGGLDYKGRRFRGYTQKYREVKARSFTSKDTGERYKYPRAPISSNKVTTPDLTLTGHMLRNLKRRSYNKTEFVIGFDGENAEKVQGNRDSGRNIIDDIPNKEKDFLVKLLGKEVEKQFRTKLKNVTITVGK